MSTELAGQFPLVRLLEGLLGQSANSGGDWVAFRCPFHKHGTERRPSFAFNTMSNQCYCHTCKEGWTVQQMLTKLGQPTLYEMWQKLGLFDMEALTRLPRMAGRVPEMLDESILGLFPPLPREMRESAAYRQFEDPTLEHWGVRWDERRRRVVYPFRAHDGRLFRLYYRDPDAAPGQRKYAFYSQKELYDYWGIEAPDQHGKGGYLLNGHVVVPQVIEDDLESVILVEGPKQAMTVWQAGFRNVLCPFGSSLSREQKEELEILGCRFIILFDNDLAGRDGAKKIQQDMVRKGATIVVADYRPLPHRRQPDECTNEELKTLLGGK